MSQPSLQKAVLFALASLMYSGAALAEPELPDADAYTLIEPVPSTLLPVGCPDHRTLKFVVAEMAGGDRAIARMLAQRDCRPLVPGARYIRCGEAGLAFPESDRPIPFRSYCRAGSADPPLYALDAMLVPAETDKQPP